MLNYIWLSLVVLSVLIGGATNHLDEVVSKAFDMAKAAVMDTALPLAAIMTIWLGIMRLAEKAGLVQLLARALRPILRWLFPDVPPENPAMGAIVMNVAANMLGLGNAATPMGLRAMAELQKINPHPEVASNAMCTFLAMCTASIQLIPATAVGILVVNHGKNATAIVGTAFFATCIAQIVGLTAVKAFQNLPMFRVSPELRTETAAVAATESASLPATPEMVQPAAITTGGKIILTLFLGCFVYFFVILAFPELKLDHLQNGGFTFGKIFTRVVGAISLLAIPFFLSFFALYAALRKIKVYEEFIEGAKEGFGVAIRIIPYLVTILTAVGMFRGAHGIEMIANFLKPVLDKVGFPPELLSLAFMRPLSGSGSLALFTDIVKQYGPDHIFSMMAGTVYGSTETTFYVLAVYFGSVGIKRSRHAVPAGLLADFAGIVASVIICRIVFG